MVTLSGPVSSSWTPTVTARIEGHHLITSQSLTNAAHLALAAVCTYHVIQCACYFALEPPLELIPSKSHLCVQAAIPRRETPRSMIMGGCNAAIQYCPFVLSHKIAYTHAKEAAATQLAAGLWAEEGCQPPEKRTPLVHRAVDEVLPACLWLGPSVEGHRYLW